MKEIISFLYGIVLTVLWTIVYFNPIPSVGAPHGLQICIIPALVMSLFAFIYICKVAYENWD